MRMILFGVTICLYLSSCGGAASNQGQPNTNTPTPVNSATPAEQSNRGPSPTPAVNTQQLKVFITDPPDGATVPARPFITGTVADPTARVWVIVHPTEVGDYWVQQAAGLRDDKTWRVQIYVGEPNTGAGTRFEIRAVANPKAQLSEGKVLDRWPEAQWMSQVIEVAR
jgi:hypothetical protein